MKRYHIVIGLAAAMLMCGCDDKPGTGPDNPGVTVSINDATGSEPSATPNSGVVRFLVSLDRTSSQRVIYTWSTASVSAIQSADFTTDVALPKIDTIQPGSTSKAISIIVLADSKLEGPEVFDVILTNLSGATFADSVGTGIISANSPGEAPDFSVTLQPASSHGTPGGPISDT